MSGRQSSLSPAYPGRAGCPHPAVDVSCVVFTYGAVRTPRPTWLLAKLLCLLPLLTAAQSLPLPPRSPDAAEGTALISAIKTLPLTEREARLAAEFLSGNLPSFLRSLTPVTLKDGTNVAVLHVTPNYVAVGSDQDYFLTPLTPATAQRLADATGCVLPTRKMVNAIHAAAPLKLEPMPIPPSVAMTSVAVFAQHNSQLRTQRVSSTGMHPLGTLVAGQKKDMVITPRLTNAPGKVAIYGWHKPDGLPIQPLYLGHTNTWVDYSHGVRLVQSALLLNGQSNTVAAVLANPQLAPLLSDEGPIPDARYPIATLGSPRAASNAPTSNVALPTTNRFGETLTPLRPLSDVRVIINTPRKAPTSNKPTTLVLYALPNGNTIEQTAGRQTGPRDDWHFNIQHIAAQTRWLRQAATHTEWVVAYLEAAGLSWPTWRRQHTNASTLIVQMVKEIAGKLPPDTRLVLTGHSGGGSFTFGYLNGVEAIPQAVERMAFLDSNYAYEPAQGHTEKLVRWLKAPPAPVLAVLAYDDARALLDGKSFVSASGGTWGRSHLMLTNLASSFSFQRRDDAGLQEWSAQAGRVRFLLKENPERKVLHTVQVERNGFIHAMVIGTPLEGRGYEYLGARAYDSWIE